LVEKAGEAKTNLLRPLFCPSHTWKSLPDEAQEKGLFSDEQKDSALATLEQIIHSRFGEGDGQSRQNNILSKRTWSQARLDQLVDLRPHLTAMLNGAPLNQTDEDLLKKMEE
jgi:hypothetical protein